MFRLVPVGFSNLFRFNIFLPPLSGTVPVSASASVRSYKRFGTLTPTEGVGLPADRIIFK